MAAYTEHYALLEPGRCSAELQERGLGKQSQGSVSQGGKSRRAGCLSHLP